MSIHTSSSCVFLTPKGTKISRKISENRNPKRAKAELPQRAQLGMRP
jgi:hypothetical protein